MSKQKSAESANGSAQKWATPFATQAAGDVQSVYNQNQPALQSLTNQQREDIIQPLQQRFGQTMGPASQASGYYGDVLSGKYMNGNPYMGQVTNTLNRNIADQVNSQFEGAGRYGSDAYAGTLARETGAADANLGYNNYNDEMNRMGGAAGAATNANGQYAQALSGAIGQNAALPYTGTQAMAGSLGQLMNGGTSVQYQPNPIWGAVGAGLGAAGAAFSDVRLKTNVELLHRDPDGLGWYSWNWKSAPNGEKEKGVLAHEVKELRPQAYVENYRGSGFDGVNYARLVA